MVRCIMGIVIGLIVGMLSIALIEGLSSLIYPAPANFDFSDQDAMRQFVGTLPIGAFLLVLVAHVIGAFASAFTCISLVRRPWIIGPLTLGTLFLLGGIVNLYMIPHPTWFAVVDLALYLPAAFAGAMVAEPKHRIVG